MRKERNTFLLFLNKHTVSSKDKKKLNIAGELIGNLLVYISNSAYLARLQHFQTYIVSLRLISFGCYV